MLEKIKDDENVSGGYITISPPDENNVITVNNYPYEDQGVFKDGSEQRARFYLSHQGMDDKYISGFLDFLKASEKASPAGTECRRVDYQIKNGVIQPGKLEYQWPPAE